MIEFDVSANLSHTDVRDVSLDGTAVSHNECECLCFIFCCTNLSSQNTEKVKYQLSVAIIFEDGGQFSLSNPTHTFGLRHAFLRQIMLQKFLDPVSY